MKKIFTLIMILTALALPSLARDRYAHDSAVLPQAAKSVLDKNFKSKVSVVKIDKDFGKISEYEVVMTDGTEVSFDSKGNWENVETSNTKSVPAYFIPEGVRKFVVKNQPGTKIVGIERERNGYDVSLSNGVDMKFNKQGEFVRYDD